MKTAAKLLFLISLMAMFAVAQTPPIQHVIIIIQENRSPDNLFGSDAATHQKLPNAHLATYGLCQNIGFSSEPQINLTPFKLAACFDPDHSHNPAWNTTWDGGAMDGACKTNVTAGSGCQQQLTKCSDPQWAPYCPQYTYVTNATLTGYHSGSHILDPYFQIAQDYGFANYMFQTNQGPSFPAHQFLFSGTSAPDKKSDSQGFYQYFAGENPLNSSGGHTPIVGCAGTAGEYVLEVAPSGGESQGYIPPGFTAGYPCYDHPTLVDTFGTQVTWKYYNHAPAGNDTPGTTIWTAPNAIRDICVPVNGKCTGSEWANVIEPGTATTYDAAPILNDLGAGGSRCALPNVSWVIPDGNWSDHPGSGSGADGGPGWVAAIVNAVGNLDNDGNPLQQTPCSDNINGTNYTYWQDTVVLIT